MDKETEALCAKIKAFVGRRNSFIELLVGPPLNRSLVLGPDTSAQSIGPLGNAQAVTFANRFVNGLGIPTDEKFRSAAVNQGKMFNSLSAIVYRNLTTPRLALASAGNHPDQDRNRSLLGLYVGGDMCQIARIQQPKGAVPAVEFLAPRYRGVPRSSDDPISGDLIKLCASERRDDFRLHYWISTLEQSFAINEEYFKIARLFSLLESIASPIKKASGKQSRTAIRYMLEYYSTFDIPRFTIEPDDDFEFDHIELAGKVRDKIFHGGGRLQQAEVATSLRPGVALLERRPDMISHVLRRDAEREISRWALHQGVAWQAANGLPIEIPQRDPDYSGRELAKLLVTSGRQPRSAILSALVRVSGGDSGAVRLHRIEGAPQQ
jgi:hypothetical protein